MKKIFENLRENKLGGFDADISHEGVMVGYTLSLIEINETDLSSAIMLDQSVKDNYSNIIFNENVNLQIVALERQSFRSMREINIGKNTAIAKGYLQGIEDEIVLLRNSLKVVG